MWKIQTPVLNPPVKTTSERKAQVLYKGTCSFATVVNGCLLERFRRTLKATQVQRCRMDSKTLWRNESRKSRYLFYCVISGRCRGGVLRDKHPLTFRKKKVQKEASDSRIIQPETFLNNITLMQLGSFSAHSGIIRINHFAPAPGFSQARDSLQFRREKSVSTFARSAFRCFRHSFAGTR